MFIFGFIFYTKINSNNQSIEIKTGKNPEITSYQATINDENPELTTEIINQEPAHESIGKPIVLTPEEKDFQILSPFANDVFVFDKSKPNHFQLINLKATHPVTWLIDQQKIGVGSSILWPAQIGEHEIIAKWGEISRSVNIKIQSN